MHVFGELSRFEVDKQYKNSLAKSTEPPKPRYWPLEFCRQGRGPLKTLNSNSQPELAKHNSHWSSLHVALPKCFTDMEFLLPLRHICVFLAVY